MTTPDYSSSLGRLRAARDIIRIVRDSYAASPPAVDQQELDTWSHLLNLMDACLLLAEHAERHPRDGHWFRFLRDAVSYVEAAAFLDLERLRGFDFAEQMLARLGDRVSERAQYYLGVLRNERARSALGFAQFGVACDGCGVFLKGGPWTVAEEADSAAARAGWLLVMRSGDPSYRCHLCPACSQKKGARGTPQRISHRRREQTS